MNNFLQVAIGSMAMMGGLFYYLFSGNRRKKVFGIIRFRKQRLLLQSVRGKATPYRSKGKSIKFTPTSKITSKEKAKYGIKPIPKDSTEKFLQQSRARRRFPMTRKTNKRKKTDWGKILKDIPKIAKVKPNDYTTYASK